MNRDQLFRFFGRVHFNKLTGCWIWTGARNPTGYGRFTTDGAKKVHAYTFAYESFVGPVPEGQQMDHLCMNPRCVNPAHVEPVTQAENNRRFRTLSSLCRNGHAKTLENTFHFTLHGKPAKCCRLCRNANVRHRRHAIKQAQQDAQEMTA